ncbi:hypothetical protein KW796_02175 [Candidatus Parcubacteria bacterium]|nr:hypothetical protein [Candidatus Parcubacteria bacterium]
MKRSATSSSNPSSPVRQSLDSDQRQKAQRIVSGCVKYAGIGGGPGEQHERDSQMRALVRSSGLQPQQIEGVVDLLRDGAALGARSQVERLIAGQVH